MAEKKPDPEEGKGTSLDEMRKKFLPREDGGATAASAATPGSADDEQQLAELTVEVEAEATSAPLRVRENRKPVDLSSMRPKSKPKKQRPRYAIQIRGDGKRDAVLQFGRYQGQAVSALAQDQEGRSYLAWIHREEFPDELREIVVGWLQ